MPNPYKLYPQPNLANVVRSEQYGVEAGVEVNVTWYSGSYI